MTTPIHFTFNPSSGFATAYRYDSYGHTTYMLQRLPFDWKRTDSGFLARFIEIFGTLLDSLKTDIEAYLLTSNDTTSIPEQHLEYLGAILNWEVDKELNALKQRETISNATSVYQKKGRNQALEFIIQLLTGWDAEFEEGYRRVFRLNDPNSLLFDPTNTYKLSHLGFPERQILDEVLGNSSGLADQAFTLAKQRARDVTVKVANTSNGTIDTWLEVDSLTTSTSTDEHFVVNTDVVIVNPVEFTMTWEVGSQPSSWTEPNLIPAGNYTLAEFILVFQTALNTAEIAAGNTGRWSIVDTSSGITMTRTSSVYEIGESFLLTSVILGESIAYVCGIYKLTSGGVPAVINGSETVTLTTADKELQIDTATVTEDIVWKENVNVDVVGGKIIKNIGTVGYDAGGASVQELKGNGYVEWTVADYTKTAVAGLSYGNTSTDQADIDFALWPNTLTTVQIRENGSNRGDFPYSPGDKLRVKHQDGIITYWVNSTLIYTSGNAPTLPLLFDCALNVLDSEITTASITAQKNALKRHNAITWTAPGGATALGSDLTKTGGTPGWDAYGISLESVVGDLIVEYDVVEVENKIVGIANDVVSGYTFIDYALSTDTSNDLSVFENGTKIALVGTYIVGDKLSIKKAGTVITYWKNNTLLYTSLVAASASTWTAAAALYTTSDVINSVCMYPDTDDMTIVCDEVLDHTFSSTVVFGDGTNGAIPTSGEEITATYRYNGDTSKYIPSDLTSWRNAVGTRILLTETVASQPFTSDVLTKIIRLVQKLKASYAVYSMIIIGEHEELALIAEDTYTDVSTQYYWLQMNTASHVMNNLLYRMPGLFS